MSEWLTSFDWASSTLGKMEEWPQSLKTAVSMCLTCRFPAMVAWGADMIQIYNDGYAEIIGIKHPKAFGAPAREVWDEIWPEIGPMLQAVLHKGETFLLKNHKMFINRNGFMEECYFSFSYSPILDGENIEGIFVSINETTDIILSNQNLRRLRDKQLKNLFVQAPLGLAILKGPKYFVEVANDEILKVWGRTAEQVMNKPVFEAIPEAQNQGYEELLQRVLEGERIVIKENPLTINRLGITEEIFLKLTYEPLREEDGSISGIMVLADEITELVNARKKMEEAELRQRLAIDAAHIGTFEINLQTSNFLYSDKLVEVFGYDDARGITRDHLVERLHPDDVAVRTTAHETALKSGILSYEARAIWPDNSIHWFRANGKLFYDNQGTPLRMLGTTLDITDQKTESERLEKLVQERTSRLKLQHEELKRSEERYHRMIEEVQDYAIILLDKDGIIQNWNRGAEKIKQYKEKEVVGRSFHMFYLPEDRAKGIPEWLIDEAAKNGRASLEGWRVRKDQTRFWGSIAMNALYDDDNRVVGFVKVTRDLTARKEAEDKLREYTRELELRNQELEQFAYVASHDLQEPLRKIQTFSEIIGKNMQNPEMANKYLIKVNTSARRMSELIKSVLAYSKLSRDGSAMERVSLDEIVNNITHDFELLIHEKNGVIEKGPLPVINGIPYHLNQVFSNLLANSLKFSSSEPRIEITSRKISHDKIVNRPDTLQDEEYFEITFKDNGIGFDQQFEKQIFTMFQRLHTKHEYPGTGIGLAICKKIMENHMGAITAKSEIGKGATFYLYFPCNAHPSY